MTAFSEPTIDCKTCGRSRQCSLHLRAEFPPEATRKWLKKNCETPSRCEFRYTAGIGPLQRLTGQ